MKKYLKYFSLLAFVCVMFVNVGLFSVENKYFKTMDIRYEIQKASAGDECYFHIGGCCTCKNGICQDGNFIGFREHCGIGNTDGACYGQGDCN